MNRLVYLISIAVVFLSSCTTLQTLSFDRLQAAEICFPEQIRRVGIVNAMPVSGKDESGMNELEGDGVLASETLAQKVASANYFDEVIICDSALWGKSHPMPGPLPVTVVDSLAHVLGVDMLLVMERVHILLQEGEIFIPELMLEIPSVDGVVTPLLRGYVPERKAPFFTICKSDTLCWEKAPSLTYAQIVKEASEYAALMPMEKLLPHWMEIQRYYFVGGSIEMRDAGVYVREQNWEEAARLWKQVFDQKKGKAKMRASYNLALSCEMQNDFEGAQKYLDVAASLVEKDSFEGQLIELYQLQLAEFSAENRKLNLQMQRFENVF